MGPLAILGLAAGAAGTAASIPPILETWDRYFGTDALGQKSRMAEAVAAKAGLASMEGMDYFFELQRQKDLRDLLLSHQGLGRSVPGAGELEEAVNKQELLASLEQKYAGQLGRMGAEQTATYATAGELAARLGFSV